ncbi:hypothetical protein PAXINDRAFT_18358 [Paxillus involutus ATCC 200175]|uniref:P-loop containing nucleoside triphosphate hydrolase protein n=1 Tax=Paxillus involutus ATCC 200175 TaxID=664439 RepID=A0A0C9SNX5_PAXIN|nr:hypothetical protein PAXINDRAFT_18358 [Paxillus involutus ATCC 200175]
MDNLQTKVILVGVGGATCSGKTTLAKHLKNILPNSVIVHQDDFAPVSILLRLRIYLVLRLTTTLIQPQELLPIHPVYNVQDWDAPQGAIDWPRLTAFLKSVKQNGAIPPNHISRDHLNKRKDIPVDADTSRIESSGIMDELDIHLFLRLPQDVLKQKRRERQVPCHRTVLVALSCFLIDSCLLPFYRFAYVPPFIPACLNRRSGVSFNVAFKPLSPPGDARPLFLHYNATTRVEVQSDPGGTLWHDPPMYWEQIVYPTYVEAHQDMFEHGDVENGKLTGEKEVTGAVMMEPVKKGEEMTMDDMVRRSCEVLVDFVDKS